MKLTTCPNGHFYDGEKYASCPYCPAKEAEEMKTEALTSPVAAAKPASEPVSPIKRTAQPEPAQAEPVSTAKQQAVNTAVHGWEDPEDEENCTVGYYAQVIGVEPVVGWLVCTKGAYRGESYKLKSGRNFIGRSSNMDIVLGSDQSVSRLRHAAVIYDPRSRAFIVAAGDSRELCYLNGEVVVTSRTMKAFDKLSLGNTDLMLIPLCGENFTWDEETAEQEGR